jgi:hypothetical protein
VVVLRGQKSLFRGGMRACAGRDQRLTGTRASPMVLPFISSESMLAHFFVFCGEMTLRICMILIICAVALWFARRTGPLC